MIIALSSKGKEQGALLDDRFGRCSFFAFYNSAGESWTFLPNPGALQGSGAGVKAAQFIIDNKAKVVLTGETGPKATRVLQGAGIKILQVPGLTLQEALREYLRGEKDLHDAREEPLESSPGPGLESRPGAEEVQAAWKRSGEGVLAVSTEGGEVAPHFGRCSSYTLVYLQEGEVLEKRVIPNPGHQPGFLPGYLAEMGVDCVIAGGMGPRAQNLFAERGIQTVVGVSGGVDEVLRDFLAGRLVPGDSFCSHPHGPESSEC